ncbi:MAG: DUF484 family protein [Litorivicinus sp.]
MNEQDVVDYLDAHPDFFVNHPALLDRLRVTRSRDTVVSLSHHALATLRAQLKSAQDENARMIDSARANAWIFERTRALVLSLLQCDDLDAVSACLEEHLQRAFELETVCLVLASDVSEPEDRGIIRRLPASEFELDDVKLLLESPDGRVGRFSQQLNQRLFGPNRHVGSAAAVPIGQPSLGALALGSTNEHHFEGGMDTLFLATIAEALGLMLPRIQA